MPEFEKYYLETFSRVGTDGAADGLIINGVQSRDAPHPTRNGYEYD